MSCVLHTLKPLVKGTESCNNTPLCFAGNKNGVNVNVNHIKLSGVNIIIGKFITWSIMFAANSGFKIQVVWLVTQFGVILVQVGLQFIDL